MTKRVPLHTRLKQLREARGYSFRKLSSILLEEYDVKIAHSALQKWEQPSKKARKEKPLRASQSLRETERDGRLDTPDWLSKFDTCR